MNSATKYQSKNQALFSQFVPKREKGHGDEDHSTHADPETYESDSN